ncbi:MAG: hypothetical protein IKQ51_04715 [Bacteroidaceae bacterium]|nr:hypothetical protein [Bacteroidaceae bacterium]MBR6169989.1 hypothetical protein [Bacteroidaceae bacterium]
MMKVIYLHGFASAGSTGTATTMRNLLYGRDVSVVSPDIPVMPLEAQQMLSSFVQAEQPDLILGTSMGAMYAEQLRGIPRILVNPSFHMARLLTFRGMGRREFRNKRQDGARDFKVDKELIRQFQQIEKCSFLDITPEEKKLVWGLFGTQDKLVNCQPDFKKNYGTEQMRFFEGEHFLNDKILSRVVLPLVEQILQLPPQQ